MDVTSVLAAGATLLALVGNVVALRVGAVYADLTPSFLDQALAQDVANLAVAGPVLLVATVLGARGSVRGDVVLVGALGFTVYSYVLYTLAIPFGGLFLVWTAVLGLSVFALAGALTRTVGRAAAVSYGSRRRLVVGAWTVLVVAVLFGSLWLAEDVPALLDGRRPASAVALALPTQPVHVLDLGVFLPAGVAVGVLALRRHRSASLAVGAYLVFLGLTCVPILLTPVLQVAREQDASWALTGPIGALLLVLVGVLTMLLRSLEEGPGRPVRASGAFPGRRGDHGGYPGRSGEA